MALLLTPGRPRTKPAPQPLHRGPDGPPSTTFTRMTPVEGACCVDCARPTVVEVEDFATSFGRLRRRPPMIYLQCAGCGSRKQFEE